MNDLERLIALYRKLIELLEQDYNEVSAGMQGELLVQYRDALRREIDSVLNHMNQVHYIEKI